MREEKLWIRVVEEKRSIIEVFKANSGDARYVERDGKLLRSIQHLPAARKVETDFKQLSALEEALFADQHPELWRSTSEQETD